MTDLVARLIDTYGGWRAVPVGRSAPPSAGTRVVAAEDVLAAAETVTGWTLAEMRSERRGGQQLIDARHLTMLVLRRFGASLPVIGRHMNRCHSTVMRDLRRIADRTARIRRLAERLRAIESAALDRARPRAVRFPWTAEVAERHLRPMLSLLALGDVVTSDALIEAAGVSRGMWRTGTRDELAAVVSEHGCTLEPVHGRGFRLREGR